jgi:hypothetical protein
MARLSLVRFYIAVRWVRLTVRRYGATYLVRTTRPRHAACGRAVRDNRWDRAHGASTGWNVTSGELVALCEREREMADA